MPPSSRSSRDAGRSGSQEPRVKVKTGEVAYTDAEDYLGIANAYLAPLDQCQADVITDWAARQADGSPSYTTCCLFKPRQNGKTFDIIGYELPALFLDGLQILHTAHEVKTAQKTFRLLLDILDKNDDLAEMVSRVSRTNGKEGIYLKNGGFIEYSARSKSAGRGNTYDLLVLDEAQELNEDQLAALLPTISASPHDMRQVFFLATPPGPSLDGSVIRKQREKAAQGAPRSLIYEWSTEECPRQDVTLEEALGLAYKTNPAMGVRITEEFVAGEFTMQSLDYFARERLGWWGSASTALAKIDGAKWAACAVERRADDGKKAFGVKFAADGSQVCVAACRLPEDGPAFVESVASAPMAGGMAWLVEWLAEPVRQDTTAAVAMDGRRGQDVLYAGLVGSYPRQALMVAGSHGAAAACSMLYDCVEGGTVAHLADDEPLNMAAATSVERPIGQSGAWGFQGEHACMAEAAALALWAAKTTKRDPEGGCVIA